MDVPNGIYDNLKTMCREGYYEGEVVWYTSAIAIQTKPEYGGLAGQVKPWRAYPQPPLDTISRT